MKEFQNVAAETKEFRAVAFAGALQIDLDNTFYPAWTLRHDYDAVAHVNGFIDVVGDQKHRGAARFPQAQHCMLRWHYRSRHESLIALSNKEFYDSRLVVFPTPAEKQPGLGLVFHHLTDAPYGRGR